MRTQNQARRSRWRAGSLIAALSPFAGVIPPTAMGAHSDAPSFAHVGTFDVRTNAGSQVAEIVTASRDGRTLIYTDSAGRLIGFVDIASPASPTPWPCRPTVATPRW